MKQIKEKFKRTVKYWRISYQQANGEDRFFIGVLLMILAYAWWMIVVL